MSISESLPDVMRERPLEMSGNISRTVKNPTLAGEGVETRRISGD
jgi:hypothetical protein